MPAINTLYDNFVLENMIEELVASQLDLQNFATPDNNLQGTAGMLVKINRYNATDATQDLEIGEGNTESIVASYTPEEYRIKLAQNRFEFYDEEVMTDPIAIETGIRKMAAGLFDKMNADIYGEFMQGTQEADGTTSVYDGIVDAQAIINDETTEPGAGTFAIVHPNDLANIRKELRDTLQYVEAYARQGYVGTVGGTNLYVKKNATEGTMIVATREAVTLFVKTGTEVENVDRNNRSETAANVRLNTMFSRKYYVAALTDNTKVVKVSLSEGTQEDEGAPTEGTQEDEGGAEGEG